MIFDIYPQLIKEIESRFKLEEEEDFKDWSRGKIISYEINGEDVWFNYGESGFWGLGEYIQVDYRNSKGAVVSKLTITENYSQGLRDFGVFSRYVNYTPKLINMEGDLYAKESFKFEEDLDTVVLYIVEAIRESLDIRLKT